MEIGVGDILVVRMILYRLAAEIRDGFQLEPLFGNGPSLHLTETELVQAVVDGRAVFEVADRLLDDCDLRQRTMLFFLRRFRQERRQRTPAAIALFLHTAAIEALADGLTAIPTVPEFLRALRATSLEAALRGVSATRSLRW